MAEEEKRVLRFMDRGSWKHSWHLPQRHGRVDWLDQRSIDRVRDQVAEAREGARWLLNEAHAAELWADECQTVYDEENADD